MSEMPLRFEFGISVIGTCLGFGAWDLVLEFLFRIWQGPIGPGEPLGPPGFFEGLGEKTYPFTAGRSRRASRIFSSGYS